VKPSTPIRPGLRRDRSAQDDARLRIASVLAELVFDHSLPFIDEPSVIELKGLASEIVDQALAEFAEPEQTEPCAMSAAKYEAEA
jgi:hypothetical protein